MNFPSNILTGLLIGGGLPDPTDAQIEVRPQLANVCSIPRPMQQVFGSPSPVLADSAITALTLDQQASTALTLNTVCTLQPGLWELWLQWTVSWNYQLTLANQWQLQFYTITPSGSVSLTYQTIGSGAAAAGGTVAADLGPIRLSLPNQFRIVFQSPATAVAQFITTSVGVVANRLA